MMVREIENGQINGLLNECGVGSDPFKRRDPNGVRGILFGVFDELARIYGDIKYIFQQRYQTFGCIRISNKVVQIADRLTGPSIKCEGHIVQTVGHNIHRQIDQICRHQIRISNYTIEIASLFSGLLTSNKWKREID